MINNQLLDFIKEETKKGATKDIVSKELLGAGWTNEDIEEAFNAIPKVAPIMPPVTPPINPPMSQNVASQTVEPKVFHSEPVAPIINPTGPIKQIQPEFENKVEPKPEIKNQFQSQYQTASSLSKPNIDLTQSQNVTQKSNSFIPYESKITSEEVTLNKKSHASLKTFLISLIIFLLVAGAAGYYFKDIIINYFAIKNIPQNVQVENPISENVATNETPFVEEPTQPVAPVVENLAQPEVPAVVSIPKEYKNNLLGISFKYPSKYGSVIITIKNGETGMELRGMFRGIPNLEFFGGLSKDYSEGRGGTTFDFMGYKDFVSFKKEINFDPLTDMDKVKEFTTTAGTKGIMVKDLTKPSNEGIGNFVLEGETAFFFNLPKFNGGIEFKFNRAKVPEYMDIINSFKISK